MAAVGLESMSFWLKTDWIKFELLYYAISVISLV